MNLIHDNQVNNTYEYNLLHDILNTSKLTKRINSHYSPILHIWMNKRKGKARFKNFRIQFDSRCNSTIAIKRLIEKLYPKNDDVMQWHTQ